ncbi:cytochrome C [Sphingobacteriales bacterium UPWRP_1]|nr:cytochrome C [Sphingobacteriales bacterium UPWRP_1]
MKKIAILLSLVIFLASCGGGQVTPPPTTIEKTSGNTGGGTDNAAGGAIAEGKGIGQITSVELKTPLEQDRIGRGKSIYDMKCQACHKLTDERVVGPGWKDVTKRRKPEWIMNLVTNVDVMLDKDPEAQKLLELCLTRMPNQNISVGDARDVLEFMRQNDGEK